ncbi:hypothetical protein QE152_g13207 [Popillia japonica]|uniref:Endonuclease/exonuclease/phosphatase domain-containing protein n=1 Tax=Popillia japonica TaxID=7064 RepID=A0AAW1LAT7_POPJA
MLALTETWLHENIPTEAVSLANYSFVRRDSPTEAVSLANYSFVRRDRGTRGGGVGIYIKKHVKFDVIPTSDSIEQLWIKINLKKVTFVLGVVYRLPNQDYKTFSNELEDSFIICSSVADTIYLVGDFNIDLLKTDCPSNSFFGDFTESLNLEQLIDQPTRVCSNHSSLIDHICVTDSSMILKSGVISSDLSDHDFIYLELNLGLSPAQPIITSG